MSDNQKGQENQKRKDDMLAILKSLVSRLESNAKAEPEPEPEDSKNKFEDGKWIQGTSIHFKDNADFYLQEFKKNPTSLTNYAQELNIRKLKKAVKELDFCNAKNTKQLAYTILANRDDNLKSVLADIIKALPSNDYVASLFKNICESSSFENMERDEVILFCQLTKFINQEEDSVAINSFTQPLEFIYANETAINILKTIHIINELRLDTGYIENLSPISKDEFEYVFSYLERLSIKRIKLMVQSYAYVCSSESVGFNFIKAQSDYINSLSEEDLVSLMEGLTKQVLS